MKLTDFYTEVSRRADTDKTQINAADTRRVLSEAFAVLGELNAADASDVVAKGLGTAAKKAAKKTVKRPVAKKAAAKKTVAKKVAKKKTAKKK